MGAQPPVCNFSSKARDFDLPGTDGKPRRDLFEAMKTVAETGRGPAEQIPSTGCSIKWRR